MSLHVNNLSVKFKDFYAVKNLSFHVPEGELVTLLGPSGCGKSTTIFAIAGIHKPNEGHIEFQGKNIDSLLPEKRNIGMVFQNYSLYPHMNIFKNIAFPLKVKKKNKSEINQAVMHIAKLVQIEELLHRKPSELSGGQQQRVALARALVKKPDILLLDEPLSNLDARLRVEMREEIRRIQKELRITTLFVTHDQEEAMSISDRVILLKDGVMQQYDTAINIYKNPINLFTAKFIGSPTINILKGKVDRVKETISIINHSVELSLNKYVSNKSILSGEYNIGIRCENIILSQDEKRYPIRARIEYSENLGKDTILSIRIGDEKLKVIVNSDEIKEDKKIVSIDIKADKLMFFNNNQESNVYYE